MDAKRKKISKRTRFEVFKRDSFKCQYCGASAPEVTLDLEHIIAHANGGGDDITNLVTACTACNSGKSSVPLSDESAVAKAKRQLDDIQERRNQLRLMAEWQSELLKIDSEQIDLLEKHWTTLTNYYFTDSGRNSIAKLLKKFPFKEVSEGMRVAAANYINGNCSRDKDLDERIAIAFSKIGGICRMKQIDEKSPEMRDLYYIRGILRNRFGGDYRFVDWQCLRALRAAYEEAGETPEALSNLRALATSARKYKHFLEAISQA